MALSSRPLTASMVGIGKTTGEEIVVKLVSTGFYSKATTYGPNGTFSKSFPENAEH
jgi:hypothetical protein